MSQRDSVFVTSFYFFIFPWFSSVLSDLVRYSRCFVSLIGLAIFPILTVNALYLDFLMACIRVHLPGLMECVGCMLHSLPTA